MTDSDVTDGGDFVVVFGSKSIFITGNVLTSEQSHLETLKVGTVTDSQGFIDPCF